jgi:hypothetical protein
LSSAVDADRNRNGVDPSIPLETEPKFVSLGQRRLQSRTALNGAYMGLFDFLRVCPETYGVFSKSCVRGPDRRESRRDNGAS